MFSIIVGRSVLDLEINLAMKSHEDSQHKEDGKLYLLIQVCTIK